MEADWDAEITRRTLAGEDEETVRVDIVARHLRRHVDQVVANGKNRAEAIRIVAKASGLSIGAVTIVTEIPDSEWELEVLRRMLAGEDKETALGGVIELFLDAANPVALVGAFEKDWAIPALTRRRILATFDKEAMSNERVRTVFEFVHPPERGRRADGLRDLFWGGYDALAEDRDPSPDFKRVFALGLRAGHPKHWGGRALTALEAPVKVRLRFRDKRRGRPPDPERAINQAMLGELMARKRAHGDRYKAAVFKVWADLKERKEAENWQRSVPSEGTIQKAYDRHKSMS
jgi:hypothetical protein